MDSTKKLVLAVFGFATILAPTWVSTAKAEEEAAPYLFGDWGGMRKELSDKGYDFQAVITSEVVGNTSGGVRRKVKHLENYDLTASVDTEKAGLWDGGKSFVYVLANTGERPSSIVGDRQGSSNIEAPQAIKLYELWHDQSFLGGKLAVLLGLHDMNSEFNTLQYAGVFRNSSFGIEPDISQVGPSIFPTTALAARVRVAPAEGTYLQGALYDGVPGNPDKPHGTHIILRNDDGIYYIAEGGIVAPESETVENYYKLGVGGWYRTTDFDDFKEQRQSNNGGLYVIGEKLLFHEEGDPKQGFGVFGQLGFAEADRNAVNNYVGAGVNYTGLIPGRDGDITGLGVAVARTSGAFREANPGVTTAETAIELTYRAEISPGVAVQPDLQYIVNPGNDPELDDAVVVSGRLELSL